MGDQKTRREQRSLRLRRQTLQVLGSNELEKVVGGVHLAAHQEYGRCLSRFCIG